MNTIRRRIFSGSLFLFVATLAAAGCGGGDDLSNPDLPVPVITAVSQFVDVGQRFELSAADSTEPEDRELEFTWRVSGTTAGTRFEDHCEDDFDQVCTANDDDTCLGDDSTFCATNSDCGAAGTCNFNSGTTSSECTTGICLVTRGNEGPEVTFVADIPGPFEVRLTAASSVATNITSRTFDTFPSLYLVGSLLQFGGTAGALVGAVADSDDFTPDAVAGVADPSSGNLLVLDANLGVVREYDVYDSSIVGPFGEVDRFSTSPAALAFDAGDRLFVIDTDGSTRIYSAGSGLLVRNFGNVGAVTPGRAAAAFDPASGELLLVRGGAGVERFSTGGAALGILGETAAAVAEAVDLLFTPDGDLLIADNTGDVVRCDGDGTDCDSLGDLDGLLADGSPSAIAVNPSLDYEPDAALLVADPVGGRVVVCDIDGEGCGVFGDTDSVDSDFSDVFFAPSVAPTTTTTSTTTTTVP